jgi:alkylation response protein AidB-like acyl-CoA dehydrogenase
MHMDLSAEDLAFRDKVRARIQEVFTPELRDATNRQSGVIADPELATRWFKLLTKERWNALGWPVEYGGPGYTPVQRYLVESELGAAGAPAAASMGVQMCGPVIMGYGTPEQKAHFLPRILSGEHYWCQGYSEPGSGSDLASLQTRAVRDGDDYLINGTKIWTTHGHYANWMFLLVRTSTEGRQQAGITFLLLDMSQPGITIQPIITLAGDHEVNQIFFDNVRTPIANRVGEENQGWAVAKYLLEFERGGAAFGAGLKSALAKAQNIAKAEGELWRDPDFRRKVAELEVDIAAVDMTEQRVVSNTSTGKPVGDATASMLKLKGTETMQRITALAMEALGHYATPDQRAALGFGANAPAIGPDYAISPTARYLNMRASTIYGGSSEVQHNIMARAALGL